MPGDAFLFFPPPPSSSRLGGTSIQLARRKKPEGAHYISPTYLVNKTREQQTKQTKIGSRRR